MNPRGEGLVYEMVCTGCGFEGASTAPPRTCPACDEPDTVEDGSFAVWPPRPMEVPGDG